jgi:hypothetical protein
VQPSEEPRHALARRLRGLRERCWPGHKITQGQLAVALSSTEHASAPLVSSWESTKHPVLPSVARLEDYATFFATERSIARQPYRLLDLAHLTPDERGRREELLRELLELRELAERPATEPLNSLVDVLGEFWHFPDKENVVIVCAEVPDDMRRAMPYSDPEDPDYVDFYRYADPDALIELHGHIRAVNPTIQVSFRTTVTADTDDYATHLVLLGGVDWNAVTAHLQHRAEFPVRQVARIGSEEDGGFQVINGADRPLFKPILGAESGARRVLIEDVAHFYRAPNPFNKERTVTICNGMYGRGTLGAVRALTDANFRARNEEYLRSRFGDLDTLSIITRVPIVNGTAVTPDWSIRGNVLHEWPERPA